MITDTNQGGNIAALSEVFGDQKTKFLCKRRKICRAYEKLEHVISHLKV
jgi:hypothetical protein